jgi:hypothetical protein
MPGNTPMVHFWMMKAIALVQTNFRRPDLGVMVAIRLGE